MVKPNKKNTYYLEMNFIYPAENILHSESQVFYKNIILVKKLNAASLNLKIYIQFKKMFG